MADLGNLFFRLGIKDEEAQKVLDRIEQRLVSTGYKVKLQAPNANEFLKDLREQLKSQTLDVRAKVVSSSTTGAVTTPADLRYTRMLEVQQRMANATAVAQQRLANERNRDIRASERHAAAMLRNNEAFKKANQSITKQYKLLGDLQKQVVSVYSLKMMEQFLVRVIEIGGEFQKQHIALNAMLGDAARADAMFSKIKTLAVESPFNFRELMSFNKQIAAFGIPYEEMYETTKRLADISAGLGVDMGRIILAYGQVRSAAFLRGQELRQFTEAGIPLVDELAKKFTELEGRVVSAGEVFEKISRREVSFGMVKDVLWELTSEGGKFYNMQEVLTESLSGKLAKLKDSWEIMLSTIAEGNSGPLASTIDFLTRLTDKWEEVWNAIKVLGAAYATYKAVMLMASALKAVLIRQEIAHTAAVNKNTIAQYANSKALTRAEAGAVSLLLKIQKLKTAITSLGWAGWVGILLSALAAVAVYFLNLNSEADKLGKKLREISDSTERDIRGSVSGYSLLINKLHKVKEKYGETANQTKEYSDIVKQINTSYGQYLDNLFHESEAYDTIAASIERVTAAIVEKKRNERYEKSISVIDDNYSGLLSDAQLNIAKRIEDVYKVTTKKAKEMAKVLTDMIENDIDPEEAVKHMADSFNMAFKSLDVVVGANYNRDFSSVDNTIQQRFNAAKDYKKLIDERNKAYKQLQSDFGESVPYKMELDKIDEEFEKRIKAVKNVNERNKLDIEKREAYLSVYESKGLGNSSYASKLRSEIVSLKRWGDEWVVVAGNIRDKVYADNKKNKHGEVTEKFLETLIPGTDDVTKGMLSSYIEKLAQQWDPINEQLKKELERKTDYSTESDLYSIARLEDQKQYIEEFLKAIGLSTDIFDKKKEKKKSSKDIFIENMKERLRLLKAAHDEYKKWSNIEGHMAASERVKKSGIFDMLFSGNEPVNLDDYTGEVEKIRNSIANAIQRTSTKERREAYSEAVKIVMDMEYDLDKYSLEQVLKQSEDMIKEELDRWNLFKSIREKTGNEGLALSLSFGQFNVGENDYMKKLRKQASDKLEGKEVTFDDILYYDEEMLKQEGLAALVPFVKAYKEAQSDLRKSTAETITDLLEKNKDYALKIAEIERKKNEKIKGLRDNRKLLESSGIDVDSRIAQEDKNAEEEKGAVLFDEFKKTEDWVRIFDDLDRVSSSTLDNMITQIEKFIGKTKLSAEETKEVIDALRKLREEQISRNPFRGLANSIGEWKKWTKIKRDKKKTAGTGNTRYNPTTGKIEKKYPSDSKITSGIKSALSDMADSIMGVVDRLDTLSNAADFLGGVFDNLGIGGSGLQDAASIMGGTAKGASTMQGLASSLGIAGPWGALAGAALGMASEIAQLHDKSLQKAIERSEARVNSLKAAYDQLNESIEYGIGGLERSLSLYERLNEQVLKANSSLSESYRVQYEVLKYGAKQYIDSLTNKLGKFSLADGTARDYIKNNMYYGEMIKDLHAAGVGSNNLSNEELKQREAQYIGLIEQRREVQEQLRLEEDKKKTDGGKVQDYQKQIAELNGQISTYVENLTKELFGIDFSDWAGQISDALINAFANGEDAAEAFKDTTNDIVKGVANKMLKTLVIEPMFKKLQKKLFGDENTPGMFESFEDIEKKGDLLAAGLNEFFEGEGGQMIAASQKFLEALDKATGGALSSSGSGESNGLSKGVAGVTEETADLLASYINAIRADVSVGRVMQEKFFNTDFPQLSAVAQAQLTQLNVIAANTDRNAMFAEEIYNMLHRNITPGKGFKIA